MMTDLTVVILCTSASPWWLLEWDVCPAVDWSHSCFILVNWWCLLNLLTSPGKLGAQGVGSHYAHCAGPSSQILSTPITLRTIACQYLSEHEEFWVSSEPRDSIVRWAVFRSRSEQSSIQNWMDWMLTGKSSADCKQNSDKDRLGSDILSVLGFNYLFAISGTPGQSNTYSSL